MARLRIRIVLDDIEPEVWRRVEVRDDLTFLQLHDVIQRAMGWEDYHLHQFETASPRRFIGTASDEDDFFDGPSLLPEDSTRLRDVLGRRRKFRYWYDFGDDWWHTLHIEKRLPDDDAQPAAIFVDGDNACPPEDCGGSWGYEELLAVLGNPKHPEHQDMRAWAGDFDPARLDQKETAKRVRGAVRAPRKKSSQT